jgi:hypothetical protein
LDNANNTLSLQNEEPIITGVGDTGDRVCIKAGSKYLNFDLVGMFEGLKGNRQEDAGIQDI